MTVILPDPRTVEIDHATAHPGGGLNDPRLEPLLRARPGEVGREIEQLLITVAGPIVDTVLARAVRIHRGVTEQDAQDLASVIQLRLLHRLRRLAEGGDADVIHDLGKYVATLAYNAVNDHLRQRFPERTRHKNRLRHILRNDPRLARWSYAGGVACGLREWRGRQDVAPLISIVPEPAMLAREAPADALLAIFARVGGPVVFEELLSFTASAWHVTDATPFEADAPVTEDDLAARFDARQFLRALWNEIGQLRPRQRQALLLNLRESETVNAIALLTVTGVASFEDVARALEMAPEELAAIWNDLPLDDLRIAARLGITRQQVINLRKAARQRLIRRLKR